MASDTASRKPYYTNYILRGNMREVSLMRVVIYPHFPSPSPCKSTNGCKLAGTTGGNLVQPSTQSQVKFKVLLHSFFILTFPYKHLMTEYAHVQEKGNWQFQF